MKRTGSLAETLSNLANNAIEKQKTDEIERQRAIRNWETEELKRAKQAAERILADLDEKLIDAAKKGKKKYQVIKLTYNDYSDNRNTLTITGVHNPKLIYLYQALEKKGLNPTFDFNHDGCGMESWYHLTANWK